MAENFLMNMDQERITKNVISLNIDLINYNHALTKIIEASKSRTPGYVCFANVHMVIEAYKNRNFTKQVNNAMLVLPDGMPIINTLRSIYGEQQERIAGMDVMPDLIRLAEVHDLKIFFFGTSNDLLEKIRFKTEKDFPRVKIAGLFAPPFEKSINDEGYIKLINESKANLVFIALGCPKQEKWMAENSSKLNAILLGVGGAFPIYAGTTKRAPKWLRDLSLEWLFRLGQEPSRLFKRYFFTNTMFLYLTIKLKVRTVFQKM